MCFNKQKMAGRPFVKCCNWLRCLSNYSLIPTYRTQPSIQLSWLWNGRSSSCSSLWFNIPLFSALTRAKETRTLGISHASLVSRIIELIHTRLKMHQTTNCGRLLELRYMHKKTKLELPGAYIGIWSEFKTGGGVVVCVSKVVVPYIIKRMMTFLRHICFD